MKAILIILDIIVVFLLLVYRRMGKMADEIKELKNED